MRLDRARISRRHLGRLAFGLPAAAFLERASAIVHEVAPGIKLAVQSPAAPSDEQLLFLRQLGAAYVSTPSLPNQRNV